MAKEVQFIHDALGQSTISNMATEATLKELLKAIGGQGSNDPNSLASLKNPFVSLKQKAKSLENGIKSTFRPFTGFVSMMGKGEVRMSAFGAHLNDSLIKKLPLVGGLFGGVTSTVVAGVSILETWNTESKKLAPAGATFGNSLLEFAETSAKTRLSMDELNSVVGSNIEKFSALGPNINQGIRNFTKFSDAFFTPGNKANEELLRMGYTFKDVNEGMVDFLYYTRRTSKNTIDVNVDTQKGFMSYMRNLDMLTKMFGMSKDQVNQASAKILKDSIYQIELNKKSPLVAEKTAMAAQALTGLLGEPIGDIFKGLSESYDTFAGQGLKLEQMLGQSLTPIIKDMHAAIQNPEVDAKEFQSLTLDMLAHIMTNSSQELINKENLINMLSVAPGQNQEMYNVISTLADNMVNKNLKGNTFAQNRKILQEALEEQDRSETITEIIRAMEQAARYFSGEFTETVIKELKRLSVAFEDVDFPELFNQAGEWFAEWTLKSWNHVKGFFNMLSNEEGRQYVKEAAGIMFNKYATKIIAYMTRGLSVGTSAVVGSVTGEGFTGGAAGLSDYIKSRTGNVLDLPFFYTKQQFNQETATADFIAAARFGQIGRKKDLPLPFETKPVPEGTKITPNYKALGFDKNLGQLIYKDGKWMTMSEAALIDMQRELADPNVSWWKWFFLPKAIADLQNSIAVGGMYVPEDAPLERLDIPAQLAIATNNPNTAYVQLHNGQLVEVNAKYRGAMQSMVDLLASIGVNISSGKSLTGSMAAMQLVSETHGDNWFNQLSDDQKFLVVNALRENNMSSYNETTDKYTASIENLRAGLISALAPAGMHDDPNKFRTGTLEETGRLFNDFGRKKRITLTGDKAILTKPQFETIKQGAAQIPMKDLVNSVNSNVQEIIRLTKIEIAYSKSMLSVA